MEGGNFVDIPTHMIYLIVVSHGTVHIGFLVAALNLLDILAGYIQNAFLETPTEEKYSLILATNVKPIRIELFWSSVRSID